MNDFDQIVEDFFKNYQDRGMKKWAGFYLSDHTAKINKDNALQNQFRHKKRTMSVDEIGEVLFNAFSNHYCVKLQLKERENSGQVKKDIAGFVEGYQENVIFISGQKVELDNINHISLLKSDS